jgi:GTP cyclohydrolase II
MRKLNKMSSLPLVPRAPRSSVEVSASLPSHERDGLRVEIASAANLPSEFGNYKLYVFSNNQDNKEHLAMVHGDVFGMHDVVTRVHSECLTGDVMASLRCDCRPQLERAMRNIATAPRGIVLYMRQEGRGIGLTNKIRAYALQETGMDTVEANLALGFKDDERRYDIAAAMLRTLGVRSVSLMTNNPDKISKLEQAGVPVRNRVPHVVGANDHNRAYLETKAKKSGHLLNVRDLAGE